MARGSSARVVACVVNMVGEMCWGSGGRIGAVYRVFALACRDGRREHVAGIAALAPQDGEHVRPRPPQAARGGRQVGGDGPPQLAQVVERHAGVHVVLDVVVHVPVEEAGHRSQQDRAAAPAEVRHVRAQPGVLGLDEHEAQPRRQPAGERHHQQQNPLAGGGEHDRQHQVPGQHDPRPAEQRRALGGVPLAVGAVGETALLPRIVGQPAQAPPQQRPDLPDHAGYRQHDAAGPLQRLQRARQPHLLIEIVVHGVLMMAHVAGAKMVGARPVQEREEAQEQLVHQLGAEHGAVRKLVARVLQRPEHGAVQEQHGNQPRPAQVAMGKHHRRSGGRQQGDEAKAVQQAGAGSGAATGRGAPPWAAATDTTESWGWRPSRARREPPA